MEPTSRRGQVDWSRAVGEGRLPSVPVEPTSGIKQSPVMQGAQPIHDVIAAARTSALAKRRLDIEGAQSGALALRRPEHTLGQLIRDAQLSVGPGAAALDTSVDANAGQGVIYNQQAEDGAYACFWGETFGPGDFLGTWVDSLGNSIHVYSTDAWQVRLVATLSRPPRPDVHLCIRLMPDGNWCCGNYMLNFGSSTKEQLQWFTYDGRRSTWARGRQ